MFPLQQLAARLLKEIPPPTAVYYCGHGKAGYKIRELQVQYENDMENAATGREESPTPGDEEESEEDTLAPIVLSVEDMQALDTMLHPQEDEDEDVGE